MRCPKGPTKKRISRTHKGNPSNYHHSIRGHTWKREGGKRFCVKCGKVHKMKMISSYYRIKNPKGG